MNIPKALGKGQADKSRKNKQLPKELHQGRLSNQHGGCSIYFPNASKNRTKCVETNQDKIANNLTNPSLWKTLAMCVLQSWKKRKIGTLEDCCFSYLGHFFTTILIILGVKLSDLFFDGHFIQQFFPFFVSNGVLWVERSTLFRSTLRFVRFWWAMIIFHPPNYTQRQTHQVIPLEMLGLIKLNFIQGPWWWVVFFERPSFIETMDCILRDTNEVW